MISSRPMFLPKPESWKRCRSACAMLICILFLVGALVARGGATSAIIPIQQQSKSKPMVGSSDQSLWETDLHSLGYPAAEPGLQGRRGLDSFNTVDFLGGGIVAATFISQSPLAPASNQGQGNAPPGARPYRLDAVFLDADSGKVLKQLEWQTPFPDAGIFPRAGGGFILFTTGH